MEAILGGIYDFFVDIFFFIGDFFRWIYDLFMLAFKALFLMVIDGVFFLFDKILGLLVWLLNRTNLQVPDTFGLFAQLPQGVIDVFVAVGFVDGLGFLLSVSLFKLAVKFIPFIRW